ncbi:MAG: hypothetical protein MJE77_26070, partial [Proteobacteria bacterium]|nr:hypothetical protein [Pseudomonadota bacterium]
MESSCRVSYFCTAVGCVHASRPALFALALSAFAACNGSERLGAPMDPHEVDDVEICEQTCIPACEARECGVDPVCGMVCGQPCPSGEYC